MQIPNIITGTAIIFTLLATANPAYAEGCLLEGAVLNCKKNGSSPSDIMSAFASKQTQEELAHPLSRRINFKKNGDLEKFRSSMESDWRAITRFTRKQERNKNRRRITEAEFQKSVKGFAEAEKTYALALNFYRQLHWQGLK